MLQKQLVYATLLGLGFIQLHSCAQENASNDDALTKNLLSAPGPTFTVSPKDIPEHWS